MRGCSATCSPSSVNLNVVCRMNLLELFFRLPSRNHLQFVGGSPTAIVTVYKVASFSAAESTACAARSWRIREFKLSPRLLLKAFARSRSCTTGLYLMSLRMCLLRDNALGRAFRSTIGLAVAAMMAEANRRVVNENVATMIACPRISESLLYIYIFQPVRNTGRYHSCPLLPCQ